MESGKLLKAKQEGLIPVHHITQKRILDSPKLYLETKGDPTSIMNDSKNMMPLVTP